MAQEGHQICSCIFFGVVQNPHNLSVVKAISVVFSSNQCLNLTLCVKFHSQMAAWAIMLLEIQMVCKTNFSCAFEEHAYLKNSLLILRDAMLCTILLMNQWRQFQIVMSFDSLFSKQQSWNNILFHEMSNDWRRAFVCIEHSFTTQLSPGRQNSKQIICCIQDERWFCESHHQCSRSGDAKVWQQTACHFE